MRKLRLISGPILAGLLLLGCTTGCAPDRKATAAETPSEIVPFEHRFEVGIGSTVARMRIAVLSHEQQRGLMNVRSLPEDEGMLFYYATPRRMSFWMHNCYIPLDIGYFDKDGVLREVLPMYPHNEDPVVSSTSDILYALEMNRGWYVRHGVKAGDKLDLAAVQAGVRARGLDQ